MTTDGVIATENIGDEKVVTTFNGEDTPVFEIKINDRRVFITFDFKSAMTAHEGLCARLLNSEEKK